jgi:ferredoxin/flavodoxin---NADP+ reductase
MNYLHKVIKIIRYGSANYILRVERNNIKFNPGQFFSIGMPGVPINREYSVGSGVDENYLDFLIREINDGVLSTKLKNLKKDDQIKILGPYGEFYLKEFNTNKRYNFFASGSGLAPFISIINSFKNLKYNIFHGVRLFEDIYTETELKNYNVFISKFDNKEKHNYIKTHNGRITSNFDIIENYISPNDLFFICGNSLMVNDVYDYLEKNNIKNSNIYSELFF